MSDGRRCASGRRPAGTTAPFAARRDTRLRRQQSPFPLSSWPTRGALAAIRLNYPSRHSGSECGYCPGKIETELKS